MTEVPVDGWLICSNALSLRRAAPEGLAVLTDWREGQSLRDRKLIDFIRREAGRAAV